MNEDNELRTSDPEPPDEMMSHTDVATGHAEIDAALQRLDELDGQPVERHGEIYDELHGHLRDALAAASTPAVETNED